MGYRNVNVDGKNYKFVIGRSHVKVRDLAVWPHNEVYQYRNINQRTFGAYFGLTTFDVSRKIRQFLNERHLNGLPQT